ncbi:hypothetical protein ACFO0M_15225 [Micromonospora mangrovi]|uniref:IPT/TIG domain-containing protein n=2 Tax=Micromonospora TaxID=1873 RepID=A0AAU8HJ66_9ACTN
MRLSRIIMALTVGLAAVAVPTAASAAQPQPSPTVGTPQPPVYVPQPPVLTLDDPTITLGQSFVLRGSGFTPNTTATIDVSITALPVAAPAPGTARLSDGSNVAIAAVAFEQPQPAPLHFTVRVDASGNFTVTYRPNRPGRYTFTARDEVTGLTASVTGTVLPVRPTHPPRPPHHGGLPVTGSSLSTPMKLGGGLVGAGAVLVLLSLAWRRRSRFGIGAR